MFIPCCEPPASVSHFTLRRAVSADKHPMSIVLRFSDVAIGQAELEAALGIPLDRFKPMRDGHKHYAQVNLPETLDAWADLREAVERLGPRLAPFLPKQVGRAVADVAFELSDKTAATSYVIPSGVAATLGRWGLDIEVSVYITGPD